MSSGRRCVKSDYPWKRSEDMAKLTAKEEMLQYKYDVPATDWMNTPVDFKPGTFCYGAKGKNLEAVIHHYLPLYQVVVATSGQEFVQFRHPLPRHCPAVHARPLHQLPEPSNPLMKERLPGLLHKH
jgi:hypothetical protein